MFGGSHGIFASSHSVYENLRGFGEGEFEDVVEDTTGGGDLDEALSQLVEEGKEYVQGQASGGGGGGSPAPAPAPAPAPEPAPTTSSTPFVPGVASNAQKAWVVFSLWQAGRLPDGSPDPNTWRNKVPSLKVDYWVAFARSALEGKLMLLAQKFGDPFSSANLERTKATFRSTLQNIETHGMKVRAPTTNIVMLSKAQAVAKAAAAAAAKAEQTAPTTGGMSPTTKKYLVYGAVGVGLVGAAWYLLK